MTTKSRRYWILWYNIIVVFVDSTGTWIEIVTLNSK